MVATIVRAVIAVISLPYCSYSTAVAVKTIAVASNYINGENGKKQITDKNASAGQLADVFFS